MYLLNKCFEKQLFGNLNYCMQFFSLDNVKKNDEACLLKFCSYICIYTHIYIYIYINNG